MNNFSLFLIKNKYSILLIIIFLSHSAINLWVQRNYVPIHDAALYLCSSVKLYNSIVNLDFNGFSNNFLKQLKPQLFSLSTIPFYLIFGISDDVAVLTNLVYLAILLFSVYKIGSKISNKKVGLFSAFSVSLFPAIYWYSRLFYLDFALTAMVALSTYLLILTDFFKDRKYSILFGISLGLTALIKWTFAAFLAPIIVFVLLKSNILKRKRKLINTFICLAISILIASSWYTPDHISNVISLYFNNSKEYIVGENGWTARSFSDISTYFWYISIIPKQITLLYSNLFLITIVFIIYNLKRKKIITEIIMLFISLFLSYCIFTLIPIKDSRFTIPILPNIAILIGWFLFSLKNKMVRNFLVFLTVFIVLIQFAYEFDSPKFALEGFFINKTEVMKMINLIAKSTNKKTVTYETFDIKYDNVPMYYSLFTDVELNPVGLYFSKDSIYSSLKNVDYLLIDDKNINEFLNTHEYREVSDMINNNSLKYFKLIGEFNLTNNSTTKVYKNMQK